MVSVEAMSEVYIKEPSTKGKVIFITSHGDLEIELWATECPKACRNFCTLVLEGHYDGTIFHRVIKDYVIQGGDHTNTGEGSESIYGKPYPDEIHPRLKFRYRGMMGIASAGKNTKTNGSQFFIVLNRCPSLDGKHTLFGKVVGQTVYNLLKISEVQVDKKDRPVDPAPRIVRSELVWDPFGDLEPRFKPPPQLPVAASSESEHRRAPVRKRNVLSFAGEVSDSGSDDANPCATGRSAHDLLDDPKLLKTSVADQPSRQGHGKNERSSAVTSAKKAVATSEAGGQSPPVPAFKRDRSEYIEKASSPSSSQDDCDQDESDNDDVAIERSQKRQATIDQLKRDIAGMDRSSAQDDKEVNKSRSALDELSAGYTKRIKRAASSGDKNARKKEAADVERMMKAFRCRLRETLDSVAEDESAPTEESKVSGVKPEEGTFASIWQEGDEASTSDWLAGSGLKFHVTADKAFEMQSRKAKEQFELFDPLAAKGNAEILAEVRKKHAEHIAPLIRRKDPAKT